MNNRKKVISLLVDVQDNSLLFIFNTINVKKIKLEGTNIKNYDVENSQLLLSSEDLNGVTNGNTEFINIYFFKEDEWYPIKTTNLSVKFLKKAEIKYKKTVFSCYIGGDNTLRINNEGFISNKTILNSITLTNISQDNYEYINLTIQIKTKHFIPKSLSLFFRNRRNNREFSVTSEHIKLLNSNEAINSCAYNHTVNVFFSIDKKLFINLINRDYNNNERFFNWLDCYYSFKVNEFTSSDYSFRLPTKINEVPEDLFLKSEENFTYLLKASQTKSEYFSFNYYLYNSDQLDYFLNKTVNLFDHIKPEKNKLIILVGEYPHTARDNGLAMFKYLMKHHKHDFDVYYALTNNSPDFKRLAPYTKNVRFIGSPEYTDVFLQADIIIHSHSSFYLCPFSTNDGLNLFKDKTCYFIRHGIVLQKDFSHLYAYDNGFYLDYIITSSRRETKVIEKMYGFPNTHILEYGLPRFDNLFGFKQRLSKKLSFGNNKKVFAFFTWRQSLHSLSPEEFKLTDYYQNTMKLINDPFWRDNQKLSLTIRLHANLEKYMSLFTTNCDNVFISTEHDSKSIQNYIIDSDIMITDYSSAALDFAIMEKPVLYYMSLAEHTDSMKSYQEYLPGDIIYSYDDLLSTVKKYSEQKKYSTNFNSKLDDIYVHRDNKASSRLVNHIKTNKKS